MIIALLIITIAIVLPLAVLVWQNTKGVYRRG